MSASYQYLKKKKSHGTEVRQQESPLPLHQWHSNFTAYCYVLPLPSLSSAKVVWTHGSYMVSTGQAVLALSQVMVLNLVQTSASLGTKSGESATHSLQK